MDRSRGREEEGTCLSIVAAHCSALKRDSYEIPDRRCSSGTFSFTVSVARNPTRLRAGLVGKPYTAALARCAVVRSSPTMNDGFTVHIV
jgi:hypothetical protein